MDTESSDGGAERLDSRSVSQPQHRSVSGSNIAIAAFVIVVGVATLWVVNEIVDFYQRPAEPAPPVQPAAALLARLPEGYAYRPLGTQDPRAVVTVPQDLRALTSLVVLTQAPGVHDSEAVEVTKRGVGTAVVAVLRLRRPPTLPEVSAYAFGLGLSWRTRAQILPWRGHDVIYVPAATPTLAAAKGDAFFSVTATNRREAALLLARLLSRAPSRRPAPTAQ